MAADKKGRGLLRRLIVRDDLLLEINWGLLLAALLGIPVQYLAPDWSGVLAGCLAVAVLLFWLVRLYGQKVWHYFLASLVLLAIPILIPLPVWPRLTLILMLVILAVRAFVLHYRSAENPATVSLGSSVAALVYLFALNLLAIRLQMNTLSQVYFYIAITYLLLTVWRWHQISLTERLLRFEDMPTQPTARIRRFNQFLLAGFSGVMLLVLLASPWLRIHDLFPLLGQLLLLALRWFFKMLASLGGDTPTETTPTETAPTGSDPGLPDAGETPAWMLILQEIMIVLFYIVSAALLIALIIYGLYTLYKRFYANRQKSTDVLESLLPKLSDQIKTRLHRENDRWSRQFGQSPEQRIRRMYYRLIEWQIRKGLKIEPSMTPQQIAVLMLQDRSIDARELTDLYELARYGSDQCTAEDVRRMHDLCQNCRRQSSG